MFTLPGSLRGLYGEVEVVEPKANTLRDREASVRILHASRPQVRKRAMLWRCAGCRMVFLGGQRCHRPSQA